MEWIFLGFIIFIFLYLMGKYSDKKAKDSVYVKEQPLSNKTKLTKEELKKPRKQEKELLNSSKIRQEHQWTPDTNEVEIFPFSMYSKVVGVSYNNNDGSSRQKNIKKYLNEGDELFVKGYSYKGAPAMAILAKDGKMSTQIGNLKAELVEDFVSLPADTEFEIRVKNLTGGTKEKPSFGVNIEILTTNEI